MDYLLNWGFQPVGTPLGSESALSMPLDSTTGLEEPMAQTQAVLDGFVEQTQRRYGNVSDPSGSLWDPRGNRALSSEVADYRTTDFMHPDEIPLSAGEMGPELAGGDPVMAPFSPANQLDPSALYQAGIGLSDVGAATLADSLSVVDPNVLDAIYIPPQSEPKVASEIGLVTSHGGLPDAFFDAQSGVLHPGMPEAVDRVISNQGEYQYVDDNGVVNKYADGTGPYDAPGMTRPGSLLGALPGTKIQTKAGAAVRSHNRLLTPAVIASSPRLALYGNVGSPTHGSGQSTVSLRSAATPPSLSSSALESDAARRQREQQEALSGESSLMPSSFVSVVGSSRMSSSAVTGAAIDSSGSTLPPSGEGSTGAGYAPESVDKAGGIDKSSCQKCSWIMIAVGVAVAGVGAYALGRKGKKAKRGR